MYVDLFLGLYKLNYWYWIITWYMVNKKFKHIVLLTLFLSYKYWSVCLVCGSFIEKYSLRIWILHWFDIINTITLRLHHSWEPQWDVMQLCHVTAIALRNKNICATTITIQCEGTRIYWAKRKSSVILSIEADNVVCHLTLHVCESQKYKYVTTNLGPVRSGLILLWCAFQQCNCICWSLSIIALSCCGHLCKCAKRPNCIHHV